MEPHKIDKIFKKAFENRTVKPSADSWNSMESMLDVLDKKKRKNNWLVLAYAASFVGVLITIISFLKEENTIDESQFITEQPVVDTLKIKSPVKKVVNESIVAHENKRIAKPLVEQTRKLKEEQSKNKVSLQKKFNEEHSQSIIVSIEQKVKEPKIEENTFDKKLNIEGNHEKSVVVKRIVVDSEALLYAVTNPELNVGKKNLLRDYSSDDVLKEIEKEIAKANLKVDAYKMLAEVERDIEEQSFKRDVMIAIKNKINELSTAIADRNN